MSRLPWAWLLALFLGAAVGLAAAWAILPPPLNGIAPDSLRPDFKDAYRDAIAAAYSATGDLQRARARLALLHDPNVVAALSAQAQQALASGEPFGEAQELARLASDLQSGTTSITVQTPLPEVAATSFPSETSPADAAQIATEDASALGSPTAAGATGTAQPSTPVRPITVTPRPSPSAPFQLVGREQICEPFLVDGLLKINVLDRTDQPMPGVEITVTWSNGEERFFTGLQPEISAGYADFVMEAGKTYAVRVARLGAPTTGISAPACQGDTGQSFVGGVELSFKEP